MYQKAIENNFVAWDYATEYGTNGDGLANPIKSIENNVDTVFNNIKGRDSVVTYTTNGRHMKLSRHYSGNAIDLRTRDMTLRQVNKAQKMLRKNLGPQYDIVIERTHIHLEYDPK